jgi:hypothetical protein
MAVRLDAAQQVKKSPKPPRVGQDEGAAASFGASLFAWFLRPTPRWGLGAAAVALIAAFGLWQWRHNLDTTPKRWSEEKETSSPCFKTLTTATASSKDQCFHSEDEKIPPRSWDWTRPSVAVYSTAAPPQASSTLRDLGDQGQAEAIRFLEKDPSKGAWENLQDALDEAKSTVGEHDPFRFKRVLVANVEQGVDWEPGDRMVWTRVVVEPINFAFAGYSVAQTDNETQKVSSIERTDSRKFSADLSATIPGMEEPKASLGPSSEHSVKTDTEINAQYEKLGVDIMPGFLRIMRQSETGGDAVGNTKVSLTAVTNPEMIWKRYPKDRPQDRSGGDPIVLLVSGTHFDEDGNRSADHKNTPSVDILPEVRAPHCALRARVWMLYEERHIDSGRDSYDESKQKVTMAHDAEDKQDVDIVSADEVSPAVWSLKLCENSQCTGDGRLLRAAVLSQAPGPQKALIWRKVVFTDYAVAFRLAHWLKTHQTGTPPNTSYKFEYPAEDGTAVSLLPVKVDKDECQAQQRDEVSSR